MDNREPILADDATENVSLLLKLRLPWLIIGLLLGLVLTLVVSRFEQLLAAEVRLAFFVPVVVYMSAAVGTQTQEIYVRNIAKGHPKFSIYLAKEIILGLILGAFFGVLMTLFSYIWLQDTLIAISVGLSLFASISTATVIGLVIPMLLKKEHTDPAVGAGPVTNVIQDLISVLIYFAVASAIIL